MLKMITNDLRKAEAMLRKNENILRESETYLFGKKFRPHIMEIEKSRKKSLEPFKDVGEKKSPFRKGPSHSKSKLHGGGRCYYAGKPGIQTNIINMIDSRVRFKIIAKGNFNMEVQQHKVKSSRKSKGGSFHNNSKLVTLASVTLIHPVVRKSFIEEIPNLPLVGRPSQFVKQWKKLHATKEFCQ